MEEMFELDKLLARSSQDAKFRARLLEALLGQDAARRRRELEKQLEVLKKQYQNYRDLSDDDVIEMMNKSMNGSAQERADKIFFIAINYRRVAELMNKHARSDLKRDIRACMLRINELDERVAALRAGRRPYFFR